MTWLIRYLFSGHLNSLLRVQFLYHVAELLKLELNVVSVLVEISLVVLIEYVPVLPCLLFKLLVLGLRELARFLFQDGLCLLGHGLSPLKIHTVLLPIFSSLILLLL